MGKVCCYNFDVRIKTLLWNKLRHIYMESGVCRQHYSMNNCLISFLCTVLLCQRELFLSKINNRETITAIEANNDTYCLQKWIEKFPLKPRKYANGCQAWILCYVCTSVMQTAISFYEEIDRDYVSGWIIDWELTLACTSFSYGTKIIRMTQ